jgi:hypothetical protein
MTAPVIHIQGPAAYAAWSDQKRSPMRRIIALSSAKKSRA